MQSDYIWAFKSVWVHLFDALCFHQQGGTVRQRQTLTEIICISDKNSAQWHRSLHQWSVLLAWSVKACLNLINCTLPCLDGHCILLFCLLHTLLLSLFRKHKNIGCDVCDPSCFNLWSGIHDQISQTRRFTKIILNSCFYIVYTIYVLIYRFAQMSTLTLPLVLGLLGSLVDTWR